MFTGIIQGTGTVESIKRSTESQSASLLSVDLGRHSTGLRAGQSVSLNGACLTVTGRRKGVCTFEMIDETIKKTNLGDLARGSLVNIERSMKASDRLEGHFVLGHVDGTGTITEIRSRENEVQFWFRIPRNLARYVVEKGSIAVDGISLTVVDVKANTVSVCLIPHTMRMTNLKRKKAGDKVNIETDILAKYVLKRNS